MGAGWWSVNSGDAEQACGTVCPGVVGAPGRGQQALGVKNLRLQKWHVSE